MSGLRSEVEAFVTHEARLLDAQDWGAWDALFTPDGIYWMPATPGQTDARAHVSLMHDDALLRRVRIARFADPAAHSLQPMPRGLRLVANIVVDGEDDTDILASGRMLAAEHRRGETIAFHAAVHWRLARSEGGLRIRLKRVDLMDADAARGDINLYL